MFPAFLIPLTLFMAFSIPPESITKSELSDAFGGIEREIGQTACKTLKSFCSDKFF